MKLKYFADVHISPITVAELKSSGFEFIRITQLIPPNSTDNEIVQLAIKENAIIVSQDLDFSAIVAKSGEKQPSVISLRLTNAKPKNISTILKLILPEIEESLKSGAIISVDDNEYRIRKLPVKTE